MNDKHEPPQPPLRPPRGRLLRAVIGAVLVLTGAATIAAGDAAPYAFEFAGIAVPTTVLGLVVIAFGFFALFSSARRVRDDGVDRDPDSHYAFPRDVEDRLDDALEDDERN